MTPTDTLREAVARALCLDAFGQAGLTYDLPSVVDGQWTVYLDSADAALSAIEAAGWRVVKDEPVAHRYRDHRPPACDWMPVLTAGDLEYLTGRTDIYEVQQLYAAPRLDATVRSGEEG